jgi:hypothetical protein
MDAARCRTGCGLERRRTNYMAEDRDKLRVKTPSRSSNWTIWTVDRQLLPLTKQQAFPEHFRMCRLPQFERRCGRIIGVATLVALAGQFELGIMTSWRPYVVSALVGVAGFGLWRFSVGVSSDPGSEDPWGAWDAVVICAGLFAIGGIIFVLRWKRRKPTAGEAFAPAPRGTFGDRASRFGTPTAVRWRRWQAIGWVSFAVFELAVVVGFILAIVFNMRGNQAAFNATVVTSCLGIAIGWAGLLWARRYGRYAIAGDLLAQLQQRDPRATLPIALAMLHKPVLYDRWTAKFGHE